MQLYDAPVQLLAEGGDAPDLLGAEFHHMWRRGTIIIFMGLPFAGQPDDSVRGYDLKAPERVRHGIEGRERKPGHPLQQPGGGSELAGLLGRAVGPSGDRPAQVHATKYDAPGPEPARQKGRPVPVGEAAVVLHVPGGRRLGRPNAAGQLPRHVQAVRVVAVGVHHYNGSPAGGRRQ